MRWATAQDMTQEMMQDMAQDMTQGTTGAQSQPPLRGHVRASIQ